METNWILTCLCEDVLLDIRLDYQHEIRCVWRDPNTFEILLILEKEEQWWIKDGSKIGLLAQPFLPQTLYPCTVHGKKALLYCEEQSDGNSAYDIYELPQLERITIGRKNCDLQYQSKHISRLHAQLVWEKGAWWIEDMDSSNGVYVNRRRIKKQMVRFGDCIYIMGLQILIGRGWFAINHPQDKLCYRKGKLLRIQPTADRISKLIQLDTIYLQTKLVPSFTFEKRELEDPPSSQVQNTLPMILTLGPSFTMGLASMSTAFFSLQQAIANAMPLASVYPSLIMALSMMAGTVLWPILLHSYEKRRDQENEAKRKKIYHQYLMKLQKKIEQELDRYEAWLWLFHREDLQQITSRPQDLWKQLPIEQEFLCIGLGDQSVAIPLQARKQKLTLKEDPLYREKEDLISRIQMVKKAPLYLTLQKHPLVYVVGNETQQLAYAIYLLLHLCFLYPPQYVSIVLAISSMAQFPAIFRFLPHIIDEEGNRSLCMTQKDVQRVMMRFHRQKKQMIVFSFSSAFSTMFHFDQEKEDRLTLFAFHPKDIHMMSDDVISLQDEQGVWIHKKKKQSFHWQPVQDPKGLAAFLTRLPIADPSIAAFPKELDFLRLHEVEKVAHLQVYQHWQNSNSEHTLAALLGVNERNEPISLDLHEKAHGPHGIIAGMTGSGKSELLITLILSLAISYHPYDVAFILIDYKGGGMAKAFANLPHIAGIITNLDGSMIQRSLNSLDSELMRRQTIFSETMRSLDYASMDIYTYQKLFHEHLVEEPLPHLVIVADEFAELKQQQPQFMEQLIRTARIGRSLGVHLLLATQKPSGVVDDQIWSNARFHICLKVAEKADSIDMLKREDGALLSDTGRFFLQVGYNEIFHQGQAAYTKALYQPNGKQHKAYIKQFDETGVILQEWNRPIPLTQKESQLQAVISHMQELADKHHLQVRQLWLPILPKNIEVEKGTGIVAFVDDPISQAQYPLQICLESMSSSIAYGMNLMEIEELFTTLCYQLISSYSPQEIAILIFDFEQNRLSSLHAFPHVFSVVSEEDEQDIDYLFGYLQEQLKERKKQDTSKRLLIIVHHIAAFLEMHEAYETLLYKLMRDGERYGMYLWISATTIQDVRFRIHQQCSQFFVYQMHDEQDVSTILNTKMILPNIHGRAIWKLQEQVYEIQHAKVKEHDKQSMMDMLESQALGEKLQILPEHLTSKDIWGYYDPQLPWQLPIGIKHTDRRIQLIDLRRPWLLIGPGAYAFMQLLQKLPIKMEHLSWYMEEDLEEMDVKQGFLYVRTASLSSYTYTSWFQRFQAQKTILWVGEGLKEARYNFDITNNIPGCQKQDGFLLDETLTKIRFIEE